MSLHAEVEQDLRADADFDLAALARSCLFGPPACAALDPFGNDFGPQIADQHDHAAALAASIARIGVGNRWRCRLVADAEQSCEHVDGVHAHEHGAAVAKSPLTSARCSAGSTVVS